MTQVMVSDLLSVLGCFPNLLGKAMTSEACLMFKIAATRTVLYLCLSAIIVKFARRRLVAGCTFMGINFGLRKVAAIGIRMFRRYDRAN